MELNATLLIQLAIFLGLLAWLANVLFAPMGKVFDERERRIDGAADEAVEMRAGADEKAHLIDQKLAEAQAGARIALNDLREKGLAKQRDIVEAARVKSQAKLDEAHGTLAEKAEAARKDLHADAEKIASDIVEKVLGRAA